MVEFAKIGCVSVERSNFLRSRRPRLEFLRVVGLKGIRWSGGQGFWGVAHFVRVIEVRAFRVFFRTRKSFGYGCTLVD